MRVSTHLPRFMAVLLVAATVAFCFGVTAERPLIVGPSAPSPQPTAVARSAESSEQAACERSGGGEHAHMQKRLPR